jgi:hypothetical protein
MRKLNQTNAKMRKKNRRCATISSFCSLPDSGKRKRHLTKSCTGWTFQGGKYDVFMAFLAQKRNLV